MEKEEEKNIGTEAKKCCSGDCRTFVIALLTSIIVVLAFHGIMLASKCLLKCGAEPAGKNGCCCCVMMREMPCPPPQCGPEKPFREFKKHHGKHLHRGCPKPADAAPAVPAPAVEDPAAK